MNEIIDIFMIIAGILIGLHVLIVIILIKCDLHLSNIRAASDFHFSAIHHLLFDIHAFFQQSSNKHSTFPYKVLADLYKKKEKNNE